MFTLAYEKRRKVLARLSGVFSSEDVAELDRAVIEFTARHGPAHGLLDFTELEAMSVPMSKLLKRAQQPPISPGYRRVFVVPESQAQEMAREFASQQTQAGSDGPQIVSTLEEAYRLLELGERPRFDPVVQALKAAEGAHDLRPLSLRRRSAHRSARVGAGLDSETLATPAGARSPRQRRPDEIVRYFSSSGTTGTPKLMAVTATTRRAGSRPPHAHAAISSSADRSPFSGRTGGRASGRRSGAVAA
jgi:hypothetical protein